MQHKKNNKRKKVYFIILLILGLILVTGWQLGYLYKPSKKKMYAEMDYLISIVEAANPHLEVYEKAMNYNVIEKLKEQREEIKNVKNVAEYYKLIYASLKFIPEIHSRLIKSRELEKDSYWIKSYPDLFDKSTVREIRRIERGAMLHILKEEQKHQKTAWHTTCHYLIFKENIM